MKIKTEVTNSFQMPITLQFFFHTNKIQTKKKYSFHHFKRPS